MEPVDCAQFPQLGENLNLATSRYGILHITNIVWLNKMGLGNLNGHNYEWLMLNFSLHFYFIALHYNVNWGTVQKYQNFAYRIGE